MSSETEDEFALRTLLATAPRPPDESFALRVERRIRAEQRLSLAKRTALRRIGIELAALLCLSVSFLLFRELAAGDWEGGIAFHGLQLAGLTLLTLWLWGSRNAEQTIRLG